MPRGGKRPGGGGIQPGAGRKQREQLPETAEPIIVEPEQPRKGKGSIDFQELKAACMKYFNLIEKSPASKDLACNVCGTWSSEEEVICPNCGIREEQQNTVELIGQKRLSTEQFNRLPRKAQTILREKGIWNL